ncbi:MAG TPA: hypothetical protein VJN18_11100 [Polyangiaceae bacterium]|nr:hypothetical protein [Polyangiaceae bacterium]
MKLARRPAPLLVRRAPASLAGLYLAGRKRNQIVCSPLWWIAAVCEGMRLERIPLDPCAHPKPAKHFAIQNWTRGGLDAPWLHPSYANPPFNELVRWMRHARACAMLTGFPVVLLGPWRSHRIGFCEALAGATVLFFKAFPFDGQKNATPFPCFAAAWHVQLPRTRYEMDRKAW